MEGERKVLVEDAEDNISSKSFTFSAPKIVNTPEKVITFELSSHHIISQEISQDGIFQFSPPMNLSKKGNEAIYESRDLAKQYKPRISRNTFKPSTNVFTQALKGTQAFEQLKKNTKSQPQKHSAENSITCSLVPKSLLDKTVAKEYFSMYGDISKIVLRPKKQMITVFYATKGEANIAYYKCGIFLNDKFNVQWTNDVPRSPIRKKVSNSLIVSRILKGADDEVQEELEALRNLEYNLHGEGQSTLGPLTFIKKPKASKKKAAKIASVKVEKAEPENQIVASVPKATIEELQCIIRQAASTTEDKYKILEARDRLMRQKQVKSLSLATAKATRGTCPDMCPEKERLMREAQRQVSLYEQLDNSGLKINHMTAVKQYSRSSADQEEPMPHELRPVRSLKMTMSYLLHEIADLCDKDTNLGEWYHFLWDRTRGIRKDITQQELCCADSVELVEQCARFHILCSERLCAEESSVFDKKINTENLTKCLQTLKYMYHDLRVKGISCINESEFRAYIILLNLNNGSFMWDLQRLPSSVQNSSEVKFAIEVYSAIVANNYVRFFKLVRKTTYLNACILLCYFNQVRVTALSVMVKAYCRTTSKPYPYPMYELIDNLGFEDEKEAIYFCEQVGLSLSQDELHILLDKEHFNFPESNIEQNRAFNVIEYKRRRDKLSVGQCIAGGTLPERTYKNYQPHDSFNSQGYLLSESVSAKDKKNWTDKRKNPYEFAEEDESSKKPGNFKTTMKSQVRGVLSAQFPFATKLSDGTSKPNIDAFKMTANKSTPLIRSASNDAPKGKSETPVTKASAVFPNLTEELLFSSEFSKSDFLFPAYINKSLESNAPKLKSNSPFTKVVNKSIFSGTSSGNVFLKPLTTTPFTFSATVKSETNSEFLRSDLAEKSKVESEKEESRKLEMSEKILQAKQENKEKIEREKRLKEIGKESQHIYDCLQAEIVQDICSSIVKEEMNIRHCEALTKDIFESLLQDIVQETCEGELKEEIFIQKTLREAIKRQRKKMSTKYYQIWKNYVDNKKTKREALDDTPIWLQRQSLDDTAKSLYSKQQYVAIENMCRKRFKSSTNIPPTRREVSIEVVTYAGIKENAKSYDGETRPSLFWKMAISWPNLENRVVLWQRKKIMTKYLNPADYIIDPILKTFQPNAYETLHMCIRHFEGVTNERNLTGMDALLFIASTSEEPRTIVRRLTKTILSKNKLMPIPLVVMIFHDGNIKPEAIDITSDLENLMDSGFISEYTIILENTIDESVILKLTQSAVLWLAINKSPPVPLEMDFLARVLRDCLMDELWLRIRGHSLYNAQLKEALKDPEFIINLHTEAIAHLMEIVLDHESLLYTDFSPEIKKCLEQDVELPCSFEYFDDAWKNTEYRENVEKCIRSLILPQWRYTWPIRNRVELQKAIANYCQEALIDCSHSVATIDILGNLFMMFDTTTNPDFTNIMLFILNEKINFIKEDLKVVYNRNHIKHFRTLPWWFKSNVFVDYNFQRHINWEIEGGLEESESRNFFMESFEMNAYDNDDDVNMIDDDINETLKMSEAYSSLGEFCSSTRSQVMKMQKKAEKIEAQLKEQKLKSQRLEEGLRKALLEE